MLPTPFTVTTDKRQNRSLIQDVTPFLQNTTISDKLQYIQPIKYSLLNIHLIQLILHYKLLNFIYQILLQQQLEQTLTFKTLQLPL